MDLIKMLGVAVAATVLCAVLRQNRPEMAMVCALAAGVVILMMMMGRLAAIVDSLSRIADRSGVSQDHFGLVLRIIGVAYMVELAAGACRDAGEGSLAMKVEMAGRVIMVAMSLPLLVTVLDTVTALIP